MNVHARISSLEPDECPLGKEDCLDCDYYQEYDTYVKSVECSFDRNNARETENAHEEDDEQKD